MSDQISLKWLYEQQTLALVPVHKVGAGFEVIAPTELADPTEFLPPSCLVLTLGLSFVEKQAGWSEYVSRLKSAGVAAIGFGTGLGHPIVPKELVAAARKHEVELFEVPRHIPFVSIIRTAHEEFARRGQRATEQLLDIQEKLNRSALEGGLSKVLEQASVLLHAGLCVVDNDGRIVSCADSQRMGAAAYAESVISRGYRASRAFQEGDNHVLAHRLMGQGERFHFLVAVSASPFPSEIRSAIRHCAGLLDILIQRPLYLRSKQSELNTMALSILLGAEGSHQSMSPLFAHVADAEGNVRPVVISADGNRNIQQALKRINTNLESDSRGLFALEIRPNVVALLFRGTRGVANVIEMFGETRERIRLAVGAPVPWRSLTMETFQELEMRAKTVPVGEVAGPGDGVLRWTQDTHVQTLLKVRSEETYGRLASYDSKHNSELSSTLAAFLKCGGHLGNTAHALGVHRHTVRTRIQKISEICECDLDNPVTRAELLLVYVSRGTE
ncbi:PucR family transcriptional regulator [Corynebacterium sp. H130]|uniref:PucR family transcriptional regulator n=1 Tax=Corynebacterium sp. H130 TaxID=3133444 RepID=UPI0030B5F846